MKNSTKTLLALTTVCAGCALYVYLKNKENTQCDFYDEVKDGSLDEDYFSEVTISDGITFKMEY